MKELNTFYWTNFIISTISNGNVMDTLLLFLHTFYFIHYYFCYQVLANRAREHESIPGDDPGNKVAYSFVSITVDTTQDNINNNIIKRGGCL